MVIEIVGSSVLNFFNTPFFVIAGGLTTLVTVLVVVASFFMALKGGFRIVYRLGWGLSRRKIAVFAESEAEVLRSLLQKSKIFRDKNIIYIRRDDFNAFKGASVFVLSWVDFKDSIDKILHEKGSSVPLVVYATERIDPMILKKLNESPNVSVTNLRGRLLNDIVTSLITTCYER